MPGTSYNNNNKWYFGGILEVLSPITTFNTSQHLNSAWRHLVDAVAAQLSELAIRPSWLPSADSLKCRKAAQPRLVPIIEHDIRTPLTHDQQARCASWQIEIIREQ